MNSKRNISIIGHRGAALLAPENTKASIKMALKANVDYIEIDVQQTLDSIVILMHDKTLNRTTNGKGLIKNFTLNEILKLDAGNWFSSSFKNEKVPTLNAIMQFVNARSKLIIEIKKGHEFYPNIEKNIIEIIEKNNAEKWVVIHSFDYKILERINNLNPHIELHKLMISKFYGINIGLSTKIEKFKVDDYPFIDGYSIHYRFANKAFINRIKSKEKKVNVWTVNNTETAKAFIVLGVDGIITDNPNILKN